MSHSATRTDTAEAGTVTGSLHELRWLLTVLLVATAYFVGARLHFAAWEQPDLFSREMRAAFRSLR